MNDVRPIFLVGFMACGKSTVGGLLADALGWTFRDTDELVEQRERRSIAEIFRAEGEERFRAIEWSVLRSLAGLRRAVVACGGGLFLGHDRRRWLWRNGSTVWLDLPLAAVRARLAGSGPEVPRRPLWSAPDPLSQRALYEKRRATYALADLRVDASAEDPAVVARSVQRELGRHGSRFSC